MKYYIVECKNHHGDTVYDINTQKDGHGFSLNISKDIYGYAEAKMICDIANEAVSLYLFALRQ